MQSRMDKYSTSEKNIKSRTQKNKELYDQVRNSTLADFDINSNVSIIETNGKNINVNKLNEILEKKYSDASPKRISIQVPEEDELINTDPLINTKEYDINAVLEKAKQGKSIDYNKERLKKVRDAQYDILNNLDLELKKVEEVKSIKKQKEEENLLNLINTITELELKNKEIEKNDIEKEEESKNEVALIENDKNDVSEVKEELEEDNNKDKKYSYSIQEVTQTSFHIKPQKTNDKLNNTEETLSKLNIDVSSYDDFKDISKRDKGAIIIKIFIFIIIISLVLGAVYILNNYLNLGLF